MNVKKNHIEKSSIRKTKTCTQYKHHHSTFEIIIINIIIFPEVHMVHEYYRNHHYYQYYR